MYEIRNDNEIYLYDSIEEGYTGRKVIEQMNAGSTEPSVIHINSTGGDVFEAIALYNWLKPRKVTVYVDGICASAASVIAMSGHVVMPQNAMMMIHNPMGNVYGDSEDMRSMSEVLDKVRDSLVMIYAEKTGLESSKIVEMMKAESWMTGAEAKALGFADELTAPVTNKASLTYEDGVRAERERLRALDAIMSPGREGIINRAKYETYEKASDIAVEILSSQIDILSRQSGSASSIYAAPKRGNEELDRLVSIINLARGYK